MHSATGILYETWLKGSWLGDRRLLMGRNSTWPRREGDRSRLRRRSGVLVSSGVRLPRLGRSGVSVLVTACVRLGLLSWRCERARDLKVAYTWDRAQLWDRLVCMKRHTPMRPWGGIEVLHEPTYSNESWGRPYVLTGELRLADGLQATQCMHLEDDLSSMAHLLHGWKSERLGKQLSSVPEAGSE